MMQIFVNLAKELCSGNPPDIEKTRPKNSIHHNMVDIINTSIRFERYFIQYYGVTIHWYDHSAQWKPPAAKGH